MRDIQLHVMNVEAPQYMHVIKIRRKELITDIKLQGKKNSSIEIKSKRVH